MHHPTKERYHYCLDMEYGLSRLGVKNVVTAAAYDDQENVKNGLLGAVNAKEEGSDQ